MPQPRIAIAPRRSVALFALLSILMVVLSYILVVLLAVACVYFPYLLITSMQAPAIQLVVLFLGGIVIAATMLWSLLPRREKLEAPGLLLDPPAHPRLFSNLNDIAASLDEPLPREVYLMGQVNAFVGDRGGILGFGSRRIMGIGLPLLSVLTVSEFRAVLAHEFAHYYSGDTRLGPWVYKTQSAIIRVFRNIGSLGQAGRVAAFQLMYLIVVTALRWYFTFFLRVINFVSRRKEYRADELACLVAGAEPLLQGLQKIHGASLAWPTYWNTEVVPVLNQNCIPAIADGFARFLAAPQISVQVTQGIEKEIAEGKTQPYDTHPPLRERIAAIEKLSLAPGALDPQPALSLVDDPVSAEWQFLHTINPNLSKSSYRHVGWDEVGSMVTIPAWKSAVAEYASLLQGITADSLPDFLDKLPAMGSRMRDPKGMLLTPQQRTQRAANLVAMALGLALLDAGWQLEAQPGSFFLYRGEEKINVAATMDDMLAGKLSRDAWVARSNTLGIAHLALVPVAASAPAP